MINATKSRGVMVGGTTLMTPGVTRVGPLAFKFNDLIKMMFSLGEQGFAYDPNDLTTLYQDATGTIPVTASGQPVGLMLDKSKGLEIGANYLNTDTLDFTVGWENSATVTAKTKNSFTTSDIGGCYKELSGIIGKTARIQLKGRCGVSWILRNSGYVNGEFNIPSGEFDIIVSNPVVFSLSSSLYFLISGAGTLIFDSITVDELKGNHAYQTVSASRPILQQTPILGNELATNGSFDTDLAGWNNITSSFTWVNGKAVSTGVQGDIAQDGLCAVGKTYLLSFTISGAGGAGVYVSTAGNDIANYKDGSFTITTTATSTQKSIRFRIFSGNAATIDNVSLKEITGYRTDQNYIAFDGVDDSLQTNNIDFTATDKVSLFAGVRKLSDAATGLVCGLSLDPFNTAGSFALYAPHIEAGTFGFYSRGSTQVATPLRLPGLNAPISTAITSKASISSKVTYMSVNKQYTQNSIDQGAGNYGNYPLYIGRRGGTTLPFNGHLYSLIGIGRLTTDSETITLEKAIAKNVGVTLNV